MSDELAPDAVGEPRDTPQCQVDGCDRPAHYRDQTVCGDHVDAELEVVEAELVDEEPAPPTPLAEGGDPADFTVEQVDEYLKGLEGDGADAERVRILEAEATGKGRVGILGH